MLVLKSNDNMVKIGRVELGKGRYDLLCGMVKEKLRQVHQEALREDGEFLPLDKRKLMYRNILYIIPVLFGQLDRGGPLLRHGCARTRGYGADPVLRHPA